MTWGSVSRRTALFAGTGALMLAEAASTRDVTGTGRQKPAVAPTPKPTPTPSPTATPAQVGTLPTKEEMLAKFGRVTAHEWGLNLSGELTRVPANLNAVALTFDACGSWHPGRAGGGDQYDTKLIELLRTQNVKATLLLNARWIEHNTSIAAELAADPLFELGNHGLRHEPLSVAGRTAYGLPGTKDVGRMYEEIVGAHEWIASHRPGEHVLFRSGTAFSDEVGVAMCQAMGTPFVGFNVNADAGATLPADTVAENLRGAQPGDIVISHMNHPERGTAGGYAEALSELLDRGIRFVHASDALPR